jgi:rSAM/selenodomain-associated transferase 2
MDSAEPSETASNGRTIGTSGTVSVIIPSLNEALRIGDAVQSAWSAGAAEVIVVDGDSCDETVEMARRNQAQVLYSSRGRGPQLQAGALAAHGSILLFLHADLRLPRNAIDQIQRAVKQDRIVCGAFRQNIDAPGFRFRLLEFGNLLRARWLQLPYGDQGLFVRRDAFIAVGGFPSIPLMEDVALMRKLKRHHRPRVLPGPVTVDPRRWRKHGVIRQTVRNQLLLWSYLGGIPPERLIDWYPPHRESPAAAD